MMFVAIVVVIAVLSISFADASKKVAKQALGDSKESFMAKERIAALLKEHVAQSRKVTNDVHQQMFGSPMPTVETPAGFVPPEAPKEWKEKQAAASLSVKMSLRSEGGSFDYGFAQGDILTHSFETLDKRLSKDHISKMCRKKLTPNQISHTYLFPLGCYSPWPVSMDASDKSYSRHCEVDSVGHTTLSLYGWGNEYYCTNYSPSSTKVIMELDRCTMQAGKSTYGVDDDELNDDASTTVDDDSKMTYHDVMRASCGSREFSGIVMGSFQTPNHCVANDFLIADSVIMYPVGNCMEFYDEDTSNWMSSSLKQCYSTDPSLGFDATTIPVGLYNGRGCRDDNLIETVELMSADIFGPSSECASSSSEGGSYTRFMCVAAPKPSMP